MRVIPRSRRYPITSSAPACGRVPAPRRVSGQRRYDPRVVERLVGGLRVLRGALLELLVVARVIALLRVGCGRVLVALLVRLVVRLLRLRVLALPRRALTTWHNHY